MLVWICTALTIPSDLGLTILSNLDEPCLCERGICICMGFESPVILLPKMEGVKDKYIILPNIVQGKHMQYNNISANEIKHHKALAQIDSYFTACMVLF